MYYTDDFIEAPESKDVVVLYHGMCLDGFTAAWVAWLKFGEQAEYRYMLHTGKNNLDYRYKTIFILDFSLSQEELLQLQRKNRVITLDHHKSALKLQGMKDVHLDMHRSGAGMSWDYFFGGPENSDIKRPYLVDVVEDTDLWKFTVPHSKEVHALISIEEKTFEKWSDLDMYLEQNKEEAIKRGTDMYNYKNSMIQERYMNSYSYTNIDGFIVPCVNSSIWQSEIGNLLSQGEPFAAVWYALKDGRIKVSLRSEKGSVDVSKVAEKFGGGGHENASSFVMEQMPKLFKERHL